jgi:hypothetical protein
LFGLLRGSPAVVKQQLEVESRRVGLPEVLPDGAAAVAERAEHLTGPQAAKSLSMYIALVILNIKQTVRHKNDFTGCG